MFLLISSQIDKYRDEKEQQRQRDIDNETRLLNELKAKAEEQRVIDKERYFCFFYHTIWVKNINASPFRCVWLDSQL